MSKPSPADSEAPGSAEIESGERVPYSQQLKEFFVEYGTTGVVVWLAIFVLTLGGFWAAISFGFEVESVVGNVGTFWAAYAATQLTKPVRIVATLVVTPIVVQIRDRVF